MGGYKRSDLRADKRQDKTSDKPDDKRRDKRQGVDGLYPAGVGSSRRAWRRPTCERAERQSLGY
ncbi:hypothetical protein GCM10018966_030100 [Streptomyces yanii]